MDTGVRKILVVIDSERDEDHAVTKAVALARFYGATLELFVSAYSRSLVASYLFDQDAKVHAEHGYLHGQEKRLEEIAQRLVPEEVVVATDVQWNSDSEAAVLQKIERYRPDLVIKPCPFHHRLGQHLLGNLDEQLVRHCPIPLLLVKPRPWNVPAAIVAAVDPLHDHHKPESLDAIIVERARALSTAMGGSLALFHSYQPLPASVIFDDTLVLDYEAFKDKLRHLHGDAMARLVNDTDLADDTPRHLAQGEVYQVLPEFLKEHRGDILVMGAVERSGLDRFFLGSSAEHTLDHIDCDLLVVKDPAHLTPVP